MSKSGTRVSRPSRRRFLGAGGAAASFVLAGAPAIALGTPQAPAAPARALPADAEARKQARLRVMDVALGRQPADVVIENGTLLDTITGELLPGWGVAFAGDRIAAVGEVDPAGRSVHPTRRRARHDPGARLRRCALSLREQPHQCGSSRLGDAAAGPDGLFRRHARDSRIRGAVCPASQYFVEASRSLPQKIYPCVSSATPPSPLETTSGYIGYDETLEAFRKWPMEIRGVDEVMDLPRVLDGSARLHGVIQATLDEGRVVAGHGSPPLPVLDGWVAAGIASSHSPRVAEALTMLRKGVYLQLKTDRTADIFREFLALPVPDWRNIGLVGRRPYGRRAARLRRPRQRGPELRSSSACRRSRPTRWRRSTTPSIGRSRTGTACSPRDATPTSCWSRTSNRSPSIACSRTAGWSPSAAS